jgi:hypothetical protein
MATFKEMLQEDLDIFFDGDDFAEPATWHFYDGSPDKPIFILPLYAGNLDTVADSQRETGVFFVRADDIPTPQNKDKITVASLIWRIDQILKSGDGLHHEVNVYRDIRAKHG